MTLSEAESPPMRELCKSHADALQAKRLPSVIVKGLSVTMMLKKQAIVRRI